MHVPLINAFWLGCIVGAIAVIGWWILLPIDRLGKSRDTPIRFSIVDILCVFVILQPPLFASHLLGKKSIIEEQQRSLWMITIIAWIIAPIIWFTSARALPKAAIHDGIHRVIFLGLIVPFAYYALIPFLFLSAGSIGWLVKGDDPRGGGPTVWFVVWWSCLALIFFFCGLFTRWMVRRSQQSPLSN